MSTNTAPDKSGKAVQPGRLPPEEKFWQRYSPHQEMPLSTICSFGLHMFVIGGLILAVWLGWFGFGKTPGLPVETVRYEAGGGGGKLSGSGDAKGVGSGIEAVETSEPKTDPNPTPVDNDPNRPKLDKSAVAQVPTDVLNDDTVKRYVQNGNVNIQIFKKIDNAAMDKLRDGLNPGRGSGGTGSGGGKGDGNGTGEGDLNGPGKSGALSQREKRMLRWSMIFDTHSGMDYLKQLRALGAVLAIPTSADGKSYKIVRDLSGKGPPRLLDEDIAKIQCIFWVDDRPESVRSLMAALNYPHAPRHFVAFMPLKLEQELFELEKKYAGRSEDQIHETKFRVVRSGAGYKPVVSDQSSR